MEEIIKNLDEERIKIIENMEETGGEPAVIVIEDTIYIMNLAPESPKERRNLCYDKKAREERKDFPPESSVEEEVEKLGSKLLEEDLYKKVQDIEDLDKKTSSWLKTEESLRKK